MSRPVKWYDAAKSGTRLIKDIEGAQNDLRRDVQRGSKGEGPQDKAGAAKWFEQGVLGMTGKTGE